MLESLKTTQYLWEITQKNWNLLWSFRKFFEQYSLYGYFEAKQWGTQSSGPSSYAIGLVREIFHLVSFLLQIGLFIGREILLAAAVLTLTLGTILSFVVEGLGAVYASSMTTERAATRSPVAPLNRTDKKKTSTDPSQKSKNSTSVAQTFILQKSAAYNQAQTKHETPHGYRGPTLYCPEAVLLKFREILADSGILGASYTNPYTQKTEAFPSTAADLTATHLHILARNEVQNTTGNMGLQLYGGLLTPAQIAQIRCLVKFTTVVGAVTVRSYGGYPKTRNPITKKVEACRIQLSAPTAAIVIDQAGYQWQNDSHNSGILFFEGESPLASDLEKFKESMRESCLGSFSSSLTGRAMTSQLPVTWRTSTHSIPGHINLEAFAHGIACEFSMALESLAESSKELPSDSKIHFKFLKAGMGFFCSGIAEKQPAILHALELARLQGILLALQRLEVTSKQDEALLSERYHKIKVIDLPFSSKESYSDYVEVFKAIQAQAKRLNFTVLDSKKDALDPTVMPAEEDGWIMATTNCADPHAMIGNEGGYQSVDAAISSNADVQVLNPALNPAICCKTMRPDGAIIEHGPRASLSM